MEQTGIFMRSVLRPALCTLLQGAPDSLDFRDERVRPWQRDAEFRIDRIFFEELWQDVDLAGEKQDQNWSRALRKIGEETLARAFEEASVPYARRYKAIAIAESVYYGSLKNHFRAAFQQAEEVE